MGVGEHHFEFVSVSYSAHHVTDDAFNCSQDGISLFLLEPHSKFNSILFVFELLFSNFEGDMSEALGEFAKWALDSNVPGFDVDSNSFRDR